MCTLVLNGQSPAGNPGPARARPAAARRARDPRDRGRRLACRRSDARAHREVPGRAARRHHHELPIAPERDDRALRAWAWCHEPRHCARDHPDPGSTCCTVRTELPEVKRRPFCRRPKRWERPALDRAAPSAANRTDDAHHHRGIGPQFPWPRHPPARFHPGLDGRCRPDLHGGGALVVAGARNRDPAYHAVADPARPGASRSVSVKPVGSRPAPQNIHGRARQERQPLAPGDTRGTLRHRAARSSVWREPRPCVSTGGGAATRPPPSPAVPARWTRCRCERISTISRR